jgi:hypothetical protein
VQAGGDKVAPGLSAVLKAQVCGAMWWTTSNYAILMNMLFLLLSG